MKPITDTLRSLRGGVLIDEASEALSELVNAVMSRVWPARSAARAGRSTGRKGERGMKPITDTLRSLRGGVLIDEASEALSELVNAVMDSGKPGKLTLELTLTKASRNSGALVIRDKVTVKRPAEDAFETILYATPEGSLVTQDPRQAQFELRQVEEAPARPPKVISA